MYNFIISFKEIFTKRMNSNLGHQPLEKVLARTFSAAAISIIIIFATLDTANFLFTSLKMRNQVENNLTHLVVSDVMEPISQGSFIEASRRLQKMVDNKYFKCANLA